MSHASSVIDIQAARQTAAPSWLETLVLGGPPQGGVLAVSGDRDYFRVAVTGPTLASIYTSGDFDAQGTFLDPDGREIAADDDSGGVISPPAAEFDLDPNNDAANGIAFANGRFYVVDGLSDKVFTY